MINSPHIDTLNEYQSEAYTRALKAAADLIRHPMNSFEDADKAADAILEVVNPYLPEQEDEITTIGIEPGKGEDQPFFVDCPGLSNLLLVIAEDASDAAAAAALDMFGECAGEYKVYAFDPLGGAGALIETYHADESGALVD